MTAIDWDRIDNLKYQDEGEAVRTLLARRPLSSDERAEVARDAAELVTAGEYPNLAATITPQHLMLNRNALFDGGLRPHAYCLPVVKREEHRLAVRKAAVSGSPP